MSDPIINWGECINNAYSGFIPGEGRHSYCIYRFPILGAEVYSLYKRDETGFWSDEGEDEHVASFRHLENAKAVAEHIEKGGSTLLDVITQSPLWKNNVGG